MTIITNKVNSIIPSVNRTQVFKNSDMSSTDIIDVKSSLGRAAKGARLVTAGGSNLTFRRNVLNKLYATRLTDPFSGVQGIASQNPGSEQIVIDETVVAETAINGLELKGPLSNIEMTWSAGTWELIVW